MVGLPGGAARSRAGPQHPARRIKLRCQCFGIQPTHRSLMCLPQLAGLIRLLFDTMGVITVLRNNSVARAKPSGGGRSVRRHRAERDKRVAGMDLNVSAFRAAPALRQGSHYIQIHISDMHFPQFRAARRPEGRHGDRPYRPAPYGPENILCKREPLTLPSPTPDTPPDTAGPPHCRYRLGWQSRLLATAMGDCYA